MNIWSLYSISDGLFSGVAIECSNDQLLSNIPDGYSCILGHFDSLSCKVDTNTGEVVDYIPEQPSSKHVWNPSVKRWLYVKTDDDIAQEVRVQRDSLLTHSDWVVTKALDTDQPIPPEWKEYRNALRNITTQEGFPRNVVWPVQPKQISCK